MKQSSLCHKEPYLWHLSVRKGIGNLIILFHIELFLLVSLFMLYFMLWMKNMPFLWIGLAS